MTAIGGHGRHHTAGLDNKLPLDALSPLERIQRVHAARGARARPFSRDRVRAPSGSCVDGLLSTTSADEARRALARRALVGYLTAGVVWVVGTVVATRVGAAPGWVPAIVGATTFLGISALALSLLLRRPIVPTVDLDLAPGPSPGPDDEELRRLRSMFLRGVSQELRTPVQHMIGAAETIRRRHEALSPSQLEDLAGRLVADARRLEQHVADLLAVRSPDAGAAPTGTVVDVGALLAEAVTAHAAGAHVLEVRASVEPVLLDESKVRRIVDELIDNVRRHTPPGTTATLTAFRQQDEVVLVVADDGPGIDPVVASSLAEPFVQGRHVAAHARPGLGLGLALVARYAELQGGHLQLVGPPDGGTRATVSLPAVAAAAVDAA